MSIHITFRQLNIFLALAETGSVGGAARVSHVTQPTVSMQLKEITTAVGLPLYEVIAKKVYLTTAGEELARSARTMLDEWEAFSQRVEAHKGMTSGRLRVAVVSTAKYFVPRVLGEFCGEYPDVDVAFEVLNRDGVVQRLRNNRDDLYIMSMPPHDADVVCQAFMANPLVVVGPLSHPLVGRRSIGLKQLAGDRFILREQGSGTRLACDAHFKAQGFHPSVRLELGSNEAIKHSVAAGLGLSVLSRHALGANLVEQSLAILPVRSFPIHANWFVVYPRGKHLPPVAAAFLEQLRTRVAHAI